MADESEAAAAAPPTAEGDAPPPEAGKEPESAEAEPEAPAADADAAPAADEGAAAAEPPEAPAEGAVAAEEGGEVAEGGGDGAGENVGDDSDEAKAATKIAAIQRGKKARAALEAGEVPGMEGGEEGGEVAEGGGEEEEFGEEEEEFEDEDELDLGAEDDGDDFEGGEGYGDFDMLEAAEVDADEEQVEEDKANLAELFKQAQEEKAAFLDLNQMLQRKLSDHLRTVKKVDETREVEKSVTDQEQRYYKCLSQVNELRDELKRLQQQHSKSAVEMKRRLDDKQGKADEIKEAFVEFKREILRGAENSRTSKPIPPKLIASFEKAEEEKDADLEKMRLSNINRRNHLRKLEQTLRQKEKLADGLHLIDFEQLKIENQTLNEKIEERNEELLKLRKKTTTTVQVLTHLKEKLQFVQAENHVRKHELSDFEVELTSKRDVLTQVKHERDALRGENAARRQQRGLVSSEELLIDFEKRRLDLIAKRERATALQQRFEQVSEQTAELKRSIEAAGGIV
jgi:hypothetical protein